jgi:hypothetical protein
LNPEKTTVLWGPALSSETPKRPFRPHVAGRIAVFFGPVAGALVSVISLRRMGLPLKAKRTLRWTLLATAVLAAVLLATPDVYGRVIGLGAEISFYLFYPRLQEVEYAAWQSANTDIEPSNGWGAVGWGIVGLVLFFVIFIVVAIPMSILFPSRR